ncbi:MAG: hypothetical protein LBV16_01990 [Elusimicrobiota bacterium]|jgi:uncharacterized membrane protein YcgQ (UPF0703/DUF1980 family)|nr:hypothetical protein [Elusimicrobiota bacterium]
MKKLFLILFLLSALFADADTRELLIRERFFIAQINEIYINPKSYLGMEIQLEGIFDSYESYKTKEKKYFVFRYGPGCCGPDAQAGFEVFWDKNYPKKNDWVEAKGILEEYTDETKVKFLRLRLTSLEVLPTRGKEIVLR